MCGKGHTLLKRLLGRVGRYKLKSKDGKVLKKLYNGVLLKEYYSPGRLMSFVMYVYITNATFTCLIHYVSESTVVLSM